jgi:hypothetical protein
LALGFSGVTNPQKSPALRIDQLIEGQLESS